MKLTLSIILLLGIFNANGQKSSIIINNVEHVPICINNKESIVYKNNSNITIQSIELTIEDLLQSKYLGLCCNSIGLCCDTLKITSFSFTSGNCSVDFIFNSTSNMFTDEMKNKFNKLNCNDIYFENMKVKGLSGQEYNILPVRVNIVEDYKIPVIEIE